jgi:hypothetical protein
LLAGLAKGVRTGGLAGWLQMSGASGLALQPPESLARDAADLVPIKPPALRKLVNTAFAELFSPRTANFGDGIWKFEGTLNGSLLKLTLRFRGELGAPQLQYEVAVQQAACSLGAPNLCFESLLGAGFGFWDYVTVANASQSVALLCKLVEYVAELPDRLPTNDCAV